MLQIHDLFQQTSMSKYIIQVKHKSRYVTAHTHTRWQQILYLLDDFIRSLRHQAFTVRVLKLSQLCVLGWFLHVGLVAMGSRISSRQQHQCKEALACSCCRRWGGSMARAQASTVKAAKSHCCLTSRWTGKVESSFYK